MRRSPKEKNRYLKNICVEKIGGILGLAVIFSVSRAHRVEIAMYMAFVVRCFGRSSFAEVAVYVYIFTMVWFTTVMVMKVHTFCICVVAG